MEKIWLKSYPKGVPAEIDVNAYRSIPHLIDANIVKYLQFAREVNARFPGFETDIHGLVEETTAGETRYYIDCVRQANS